MRELFNCVSDTTSKETCISFNGLTSQLMVGQTQQLTWHVENLVSLSQVNNGIFRRQMLSNSVHCDKISNSVPAFVNNISLEQPVQRVATPAMCTGHENTLRECFHSMMTDYNDTVAGLTCSMFNLWLL